MDILDSLKAKNAAHSIGKRALLRLSLKSNSHPVDQLVMLMCLWLKWSLGLVLHQTFIIQ